MLWDLCGYLAVSMRIVPEYLRERVCDLCHHVTGSRRKLEGQRTRHDATTGAVSSITVGATAGSSQREILSTSLEDQRHQVAVVKLT